MNMTSTYLYHQNRTTLKCYFFHYFSDVCSLALLINRFRFWIFLKHSTNASTHLSLLLNHFSKIRL